MTNTTDTTAAIATTAAATTAAATDPYAGRVVIVYKFFPEKHSEGILLETPDNPDPIKAAIKEVHGAGSIVTIIRDRMPTPRKLAPIGHLIYYSTSALFDIADRCVAVDESGDCAFQYFLDEIMNPYPGWDSYFENFDMTEMMEEFVHSAFSGTPNEDRRLLLWCYITWCLGHDWEASTDPDIMKIREARDRNRRRLQG